MCSIPNCFNFFFCSEIYTPYNFTLILRYLYSSHSPNWKKKARILTQLNEEIEHSWNLFNKLFYIKSYRSSSEGEELWFWQKWQPVTYLCLKQTYSAALKYCHNQETNFSCPLWIRAKIGKATPPQLCEEKTDCVQERILRICRRLTFVFYYNIR